MTYDLRGNGKSVLKVNAGRYYGLGMTTASTLQPTQATTLRYAWRDLNGDNSVQRNELDLAKGFLTPPTSNYNPANPSAAVTPATVDPNLRNDKTDEADPRLRSRADGQLRRRRELHLPQILRPAGHLSNAGLHRGVRRGAVHGGVRQRWRRAARRRTAAPTTSVRSRCTPQTILRNDTKYNTYNGVEFTARKRLATSG